MPDQILVPTSNTSPDPGQGGSAVSSPSNTGHGNTLVQSSRSTSGTDSDSASCIWTTFQSPAGAASKITLTFDWAENGEFSSNSPTCTADFTVDYSVDGGSNWVPVVDNEHSGSFGLSTPFGDSGSEEVDINSATPISQIRVRNRIATSVVVSAGSGDIEITASISNIQLEIEYETSKIILGMM